MPFEELEDQGLIRKAKTNFKQIYNFLSRSEKDLFTSRTNLSIDQEWSYTIAYHAILRAGRALMMSHGYRPKGKDQHRTVIRFTNIVLGKQYKDLISQLNRMRRKRHDFIYEPNRPIPKQEAEQAVTNAEALVKHVLLYVKERDSQEGLDFDSNLKK